MPDDVKGEVAWLYCVLRPGFEPGDELRAEVSRAVTAVLGKAFAPARIGFVTGLPKTRSAKIVRRAVRATALGADVGDTSSIEDPGVLAQVAAAR
jgi:acetyl-CoA synthetase